MAPALPASRTRVRGSSEPGRERARAVGAYGKRCLVPVWMNTSHTSSTRAGADVTVIKGAFPPGQAVLIGAWRRANGWAKATHTNSKLQRAAKPRVRRSEARAFELHAALPAVARTAARAPLLLLLDLDHPPTTPEIANSQNHTCEHSRPTGIVESTLE